MNEGGGDVGTPQPPCVGQANTLPDNWKLWTDLELIKSLDTGLLGSER